VAFKGFFFFSLTDVEETLSTKREFLSIIFVNAIQIRSITCLFWRWATFQRKFRSIKSNKTFQKRFKTYLKIAKSQNFHKINLLSKEYQILTIKGNVIRKFQIGMDSYVFDVCTTACESAVVNIEQRLVCSWFYIWKMSVIGFFDLFVIGYGAKELDNEFLLILSELFTSNTSLEHCFQMNWFRIEKKTKIEHIILFINKTGSSWTSKTIKIDKFMIVAIETPQRTISTRKTAFTVILLKKL
jgi:hypothetical protein